MGKTTDSVLNISIKRYSELLNEYCGHILKGDFSDYPKIRSIQVARIEKDKREFEEFIDTTGTAILFSIETKEKEVRTVKLQKDESDFLNSHLKGYDFREGKNAVPEVQCKVLFETLIDLFLSIGLDEEDEATKLGCFIEDLAFKFFVEDAFLP